MRRGSVSLLSRLNTGMGPSLHAAPNAELAGCSIIDGMLLDLRHSCGNSALCDSLWHGNTLPARFVGAANRWFASLPDPAEPSSSVSDNRQRRGSGPSSRQSSGRPQPSRFANHRGGREQQRGGGGGGGGGARDPNAWRDGNVGERRGPTSPTQQPSRGSRPPYQQSGPPNNNNPNNSNRRDRPPGPFTRQPGPGFDRRTQQPGMFSRQPGNSGGLERRGNQQPGSFNRQSGPGPDRRGPQQQQGVSNRQAGPGPDRRGSQPGSFTRQPGQPTFDRRANQQPSQQRPMNDHQRSDRLNTNRSTSGNSSFANNTQSGHHQRSRNDVSPSLIGRTHWLFKDKEGSGAAQPPQNHHQNRNQSASERQRAQQQQQAPELEQVIIPDNVTVLRLASLLNVSTDVLERTLSDLGDAPHSEQEMVSPDAAELAALEHGRMAVFASVKRHDGAGNAAPRPPVVTVMGHVDHGKTSLLDALRSTSVAAKEAGGITQHIGAFEVAMPGSKQSVTFIDTPGHAAFTAMRARGAAVTDIVVLAVAADDGIMPQTKEALAHAQSAGCPVVVAITKCDLPAADAERVRRQLMAEGLELEQMGGNVQVIEVAATQGLGLQELEEAIVLQAEMLDLKADPVAPATGVVVEAKMDKGQGPSATVIVTRGTLKVGQAVVIGTEWGKVRALRGSGGAALKEVLPGQPAEIVGLKGLPLAGDDLLAVVDEERAQRVSKARTDRSEWRRRAALARITYDLDDDGSEVKVLPVVLKADVRGSVEAVKDALTSLSSDTVQVRVVHAGVGPVSLSDVQLAIPSGARVIGFNVKAAGADVEAEAKKRGVEVVCRRVIYELLDDVSAAVVGAAPKERKEIVAGAAEILQMFPLTAKRGNKEVQQAVVAGCRVVDGSMRTSLRFRVMRGEEMVFEGPCVSIRRHKLEVDAVGKGTECGVRLDGFNDFHLGDTLQCIDETFA